MPISKQLPNVGQVIHLDSGSLLSFFGRSLFSFFCQTQITSAHFSGREAVTVLIDIRGHHKLLTISLLRFPHTSKRKLTQLQISQPIPDFQIFGMSPTY